MRDQEDGQNPAGPVTDDATAAASAVKAPDRGIRISVVTSLYRSETYIEEFYSRCVAAISEVTDDYEIILVNDASPDRSYAIARGLAERDEKVVLVDLSRNFGQHKAILTGLRYVTGDYVFICDSDLEEDPAWIVEFYGVVCESGSDVAFGVQIAPKGSMFYKLGSRLFYGLMRFLSRSDFPNNLVTARLISRRYLDAMLEFEEREVFLAGIWYLVGFHQVPVLVRKVSSSPTSYTLWRLIGLFVNAVTSFSNRPLHIISVFGLFLCILAVLIVLYLVYAKLVLGLQSEGWASVMATIIMVGGITIFFNGIIAIYVAKIFMEVKRRPISTVREVVTKEGCYKARHQSSSVGLGDGRL